MNTSICHIEYLLRHHDCVVLPGWGAFIGAYSAARFAGKEGEELLPPRVELCFNEALKEQDGLLCHSVARREQISYEAACQLVERDVDLLRHQLEDQGEVVFGHLGTFRKRPGEPMEFFPESDSPANASYFGLRPVDLAALTAQESAPSKIGSVNATPSEVVPVSEEVPHQRATSWRGFAASVAASVAVIVSLGLFVFSPSKTERQVTASMAPVPSAAKVEEKSPALPTHLTIAPAPEAPIKVVLTPAAEKTSSQKIKETPKINATPLSSTGNYCLVVASFPSRRQAEQYLSENSNASLGVLEKDGRFRVYAATGSTYGEVEAQKNASRYPDAWVCRR